MWSSHKRQTTFLWLKISLPGSRRRADVTTRYFPNATSHGDARRSAPARRAGANSKPNRTNETDVHRTIWLRHARCNATTPAGQDDERVAREQHGTPVEGELVDRGRRSGRGRVRAKLYLPPVQRVVRRVAGGGELERRRNRTSQSNPATYLLEYPAYVPTSPSHNSLNRAIPGASSPRPPRATQRGWWL